MKNERISKNGLWIFLVYFFLALYSSPSGQTKEKIYIIVNRIASSHSLSFYFSCYHPAHFSSLSLLLLLLFLSWTASDESTAIWRNVFKFNFKNGFWIAIVFDAVLRMLLCVIRIRPANSRSHHMDVPQHLDVISYTIRAQTLTQTTHTHTHWRGLSM